MERPRGEAGTNDLEAGVAAANPPGEKEAVTQ